MQINIPSHCVLQVIVLEFDLCTLRYRYAFIHVTFVYVWRMIYIKYTKLKQTGYIIDYYRQGPRWFSHLFDVGIIPLVIGNVVVGHEELLLFQNLKNRLLSRLHSNTLLYSSLSLTNNVDHSYVVMFPAVDVAEFCAYPTPINNYHLATQIRNKTNYPFSRKSGVNTKYPVSLSWVLGPIRISLWCRK